MLITTKTPKHTPVDFTSSPDIMWKSANTKTSSSSSRGKAPKSPEMTPSFMERAGVISTETVEVAFLESWDRHPGSQPSRSKKHRHHHPNGPPCPDCPQNRKVVKEYPRYFVKKGEVDLEAFEELDE